MFETITTEAIKEVLDGIKKDLYSAWMEKEKLNAIEKESDENIKAENKRVMEEYNLRYSNVPPRNRPALPTVDEKKIKKQVKDKYSDQFNQEWDKRVKKIFTDQIEKFNLENIMAMLFKRHEWLNKDILVQGKEKNFIGFQFLVDFLNNQLTILLDGPPWVGLTNHSLSGLKWKPLDIKWLGNFIEDYLYSNIDKYYAYTEAYPNIHLISKLDASPLYYLNSNKDPFKSPDWINHRLTRIDLFRYLSKSYSNEVNVINGPAKIVPVHIDELSKPTFKWNHFETLLVNVSTEDKPFWILLDTKDKNVVGNKYWVAYVPNFINNAPLQKLVNIINKLNTKTVTYETNAQLSDIEKMSAEAMWHAVLLERVLPWCRGNFTTPTLKDYRATVPLPLMLRNVLSHSTIPAHILQREIKKLFLRYKPFSDISLNQLGSNLLLLNSENELPMVQWLLTTVISNPVSMFEQFIVLDPDAKKIEVISNTEFPLTIEGMIHALLLVYHHPITTMILPNSIIYSDTIHALYSNDINLKSIQPSAGVLPSLSQWYEYPFCNAARNRFMTHFAPEKVDPVKMDVAKRKNLWKMAGEEIFNYFTQYGNKIDIDFFNEMIPFNKKWRGLFCQDEAHPTIAYSIWHFCQIAQMGVMGLNELFAALEKHLATLQWEHPENPQFNFSAVFDLAGSLAAEPEDYILTLKEHIKKLYADNPDCSNVFKKLSFILPDSLEGLHDAIIQLITVLNDRVEKYPEEVKEIALYNLNIDDKLSLQLIEELEKLNNRVNLQLIITIPAWDREAYPNRENQLIKAKYINLQNAVLDNRRMFKQDQLQKNIQPIQRYVNGELKQDIILSNVSQQAQPWNGENISYPLTAEVNTQHQLEQQLHHNVSHQQQVQKEKMQESKISPYLGNEYELITRENIDDKCLSDWNNLPEKIKLASGCENNQLRSLFSRWVGSDINAPNIIAKIEKKAVQKIMEHADQFRLGICKDNLPAGFYLASIPSKSELILCFNEQLQKTNRVALKKLPLKERNPFTVKLHAPKEAVAFKGDFRQFSSLCRDDIKMQQTLWRYLATEMDDTKQIENAKAYLSSVQCDEKEAVVTMQGVDVFGATQTPDSLAACIAYLKKWVSEQTKSAEFAQDLFLTSDKTERNLKAFGQLFNEYHVKNPKIFLSAKKINGVDSFITLANQIYTDAGKEHFYIWKRYFLDNSANWSECLEGEEIEAMVQSLNTLKNQKTYQAFWWRLIDAHGRATTNLRYADLWYAFQKIMNFIDKKNLILNVDALFTYLDSNPNFNALVFFDHLYFVLNAAEGYGAAHDIQQHILNSVDRIDWKHSGFYYANRYQSYPYWHDALQLTKLSSASNNQPAAYLPEKWDSQILFVLPKVQALRFAVQKMKLNHAEFNQFDQLLSRQLPDANANIIRLFTACLAIGIDRLEEVNPLAIQQTTSQLTTINPDILAWLNKALILDDDLLHGTIEMQFVDIVVFARVLEKLQLNVTQLSEKDIVPFINACGRALRYFKGHNESTSEENLTSLLTYCVEKNHLLHPLLTDYPWLLGQKNDIDDLSKYAASDHPQLEMLQKQLRSIEFAKSKYFPSLSEIDSAYQALSNIPANDNQPRRKYISQWIANGCSIVKQDAIYRKLNANECTQATTFIENNVQSNFHNHNVELFKKLVNHHLVVNGEIDAQKQIEKLMNLFILLDNKPYFNDLGQVIGLLISKAKEKNETKYYSVNQLCVWLQVLIGEVTNDEVIIDKINITKNHYPINILDTLLANAGSNHASSLINTNLNLLSEIPDIEKLLIINTISRSKLSNHYKKDLVDLAFKPHATKAFILSCKNTLSDLCAAAVDTRWTDKISALMLMLGEQESDQSLVMIKRFAARFNEVTNSDPHGLTALWEENQTKLINMVMSKTITFAEIEKLYPLKLNPYLQLILVRAMSAKEPVDSELIIELQNKLSTLPNDELIELAKYYQTDPVPSMAVLRQILNEGKITAKDVVHYYETVIQAQDQNGHSKRIYSLTEDDHANLLRVVNGIKRKGKEFIDDKEQKQLINLFFYANTYCISNQLHNIEMSTLQQTITNILKKIKNAHKEAKEYLSAELLACLREVILRKTGMWANHTQMIALIYAALHQNDKILNQLRTGEGKSIITLMESTYLALNGYIVDVFSAKDSLSKRDHNEFAPVFDALKIPHSFVTETSDVNEYHSENTTTGIGAIHYATVGNLSLFHTMNAWKGINTHNLLRDKRAAFLDECDYLLLTEKTIFNSSTSSGKDIYNMDEWVYRLAYDYYQNNHIKFTRDTSGLRVARDPHLKNLCTLIQQHAHQSPQESTFIQKYLVPAIEGDPECVKKRDQQLMQLLTAAHTAARLKEGVAYCIMPSAKELKEGMVINTHAAKVMIDAQMREGSTYSDKVQQFLHIILNDLAVTNGMTPDFFVDPLSQIALSLNVINFLNKFYTKLEGCTGTAGNADDLKVYRSDYGIDHVVKLPTHAPIKTELLPTEYCDSEDAQVNAIVAHIKSNSHRPILLTCRDDIEVKRLGEKIRLQLVQWPGYQSEKFIVDTNDSGKNEEDILLPAGLQGAVTISARMGRGTNIKPKGIGGLMVLRTYPTIPKIAKQEYGRQGRNGELGRYGDVIDFSKVLQEYDLMLTNNKEKIEHMMFMQQKHLLAKLEKHEQAGSKKWSFLHDENMQKKYLITRSVEALKAKIKNEHEKYARHKDNVKAILSIEVMLHIKPGSNTLKDYQEEWLACCQKIDAAWNSRLAGKTGDSPEIYQHFLHQVDEYWRVFCKKYSYLNKGILQKFPPISFQSKSEEDIDTKPHVRRDKADMPAILTFYQHWLEGIQSHFYTKEGQLSDAVSIAMFGKDNHELLSLFRTLKNKTMIESFENPETMVAHHIKLFRLLDYFIKNKSLFSISCATLSQIIDHASSLYNDDHHDNYLKQVELFLSQKWLTEKAPNQNAKNDIEKNGLLLNVVSSISGVNDEDRSISLRFIPSLCQTIYSHYWDKFNYTFSHDLSHVFASSKTPQLITLHADQVDLIYFIKLIHENSELASEIREARLKKLTTYIERHSKDLEKDPQLLRPIFTLALSDGPHLPNNINPFSGMPSSTAVHFWQFLNNRGPKTRDENDCQILIDTLTKRYESLPRKEEKDNYFSQVIQPIMQLPAYISLHYINKYLKLTQGKTNIEDVQEKLEQIKQAGEAWNTFRLNKNLLDNNPDLITWMKAFDQLSPTENRQSFTLANEFPSVPLPYCLTIMQLYTNKLIKHNQLRTVFELAASIHGLDDKPRAKQFFENAFLSMKKNKNSINEPIVKMKYFIAELNKYHIDSEHLALFFSPEIDFDRGIIDRLFLLESKINKNKINKKLRGSHVTFLQKQLALLPKRAGAIPAYLDKISLFIDALKGSDQFDEDTLTLLFSHWSLALPDQGLKILLSIPTVIQSLPSNVIRNYLLYQHRELIQKPTSLHHIQQFYQFVDVLKDHSHCDDEMIKTIFHCHLKTDKHTLETIFKLVDKIERIPDNMSKLLMLGKFKKMLESSTELTPHLTRFKEFVTLLDGIPCNTKTTEALYSSWEARQDEAVKNYPAWYKEIHALADDAANVQSYFSSVNRNQAKRCKLMQYVYHDLLEVDESFKTRCYLQYAHLAKTIFMPERLNKTASRTQLRHSYQQIIGLTREIAQIAQHPLARPSGSIKIQNQEIRNQVSNLADTKKTHQLFFDQKKDQYQSFRMTPWKNWTRKKQANDLFISLNVTTTNISLNNQQAYYSDLFGKITEAQNELLKSDIGTNRNKKGYSRLYDITVQLFVTVARDYLADRSINFEEKSSLNERLGEQLTYHLSILRDRLPKGHDQLKARLNDLANNNTPWTAGSIKLLQLNQLVKGVNVAALPKSLHYLINNLSSFIELTQENTRISYENK